MTSTATAFAPEWAAGLFRETPDAGPELRAPEPRAVALGDDEDDVVGRFRRINHFEALYRLALEGAGVEPPPSPLILVLGAGDGVNAVAPCLRVFRGARIVATDPSGREFPALRRHLDSSGAADRVVCFQMEPEAELPQADSFDLVAGASILHKRVDPDRTLANVHRVLKPGGHAVFMEPFDGYGLIRLAFERIRAEADLRGEVLEPALQAALAAAIDDIAVRTMPDPASPGFLGLENKWLFSRESLAAGARQIGFREARFFSHNDHPSLYRDMGEVMLNALAGPQGAPLPDWAWSILESFDHALPPPVKRLLMLDGAMVLTK